MHCSKEQPNPLKISLENRGQNDSREGVHIPPAKYVHHQGIWPMTKVQNKIEVAENSTKLQKTKFHFIHLTIRVIGFKERGEGGLNRVLLYFILIHETWKVSNIQRIWFT